MRCCVSAEINSVWGPDGGKEDRNISRETTTRGREELKPRITSAGLLGLLVSSLSKHFDTAHFFTLFKSIRPAYTLTSFLTKPWRNLSLAASSCVWLEKGTQPWGLSHIDCMSVNCRRPRCAWRSYLVPRVDEHCCSRRRSIHTFCSFLSFQHLLTGPPSQVVMTFIPTEETDVSTREHPRLSLSNLPTLLPLDLHTLLSLLLQMSGSPCSLLTCTPLSPASSGSSPLWINPITSTYAGIFFLNV